MIEPKFNKGDYIINRSAGDLAIVNNITKKGYYTFEVYYTNMFKEFMDLKKYTYELQMHYQKFWDFCNKKEKDKLNKLIKQKGEK